MRPAKPTNNQKHKSPFPWDRVKSRRTGRTVPPQGNGFFRSCTEGEMPKAPSQFPFWYNDWSEGTKHLDHVERACYLDLLIFQFQNGQIPDEQLVRMTLCRIGDVGQWERIWRHIADKFEPYDEGERTVLRNPKMAEIRDEAIAWWKPRKALSDARRKAGKKGGEASGKARRGSKTPEKKGSNARSKNEAKSKQNEATSVSGKRLVVNGSLLENSPFSELEIPDALIPIADDIHRWFAHCESANPKFTVFVAETQLMEFARRGPDESKKAIARSLEVASFGTVVWGPRKGDEQGVVQI